MFHQKYYFVLPPKGVRYLLDQPGTLLTLIIYSYSYISISKSRQIVSGTIIKGNFLATFEYSNFWTYYLSLSFMNLNGIRAIS